MKIANSRLQPTVWIGTLVREELDASGASAHLFARVVTREAEGINEAKERLADAPLRKSA